MIQRKGLRPASRIGTLALVAWLLVSASGHDAEAGIDVLAQLSIRIPHVPGGFYGRVHRFDASRRDYSGRTLYGYSFRQSLGNGAVREIEALDVRSPGAYLMATDLFGNGRLSTMAHTVLMVFPRPYRWDSALYGIVEAASGDLRVVAPNGASLRIDGETGGIETNRDFWRGSIGTPGTPPRFGYRGLHVEIRSVGRSPFLRGTPVTVRGADGASCRLLTDDLFSYGASREPARFRFDEDVPLYAFLRRSCPQVTLPDLREAASRPQPGGILPVTVPGTPTPAPHPLLRPAASGPGRAVPDAGSPTLGKLFRRLFSF